MQDFLTPTNQYLEANAPWKLVKTDREAAKRVLFNAVQSLRVAAILLKLSEKHKITVSAMLSDHGKFTSGGSVSNHWYGRAVDVAVVEMLRRGFDAQRADHSHPLAECNREGGVARTAPDQQHSRIADGIALGRRCGAGGPAQHGGMQGAHAQRGRDNGRGTRRGPGR